MSRQRTVRAALVSGPMYDPLYETIPRFERETGLRVEFVVRLPHPELNTWVKQAFEEGDPDVDVLSTHTKYAPSQARWLSPLDGAIPAEDLADLLDRPLALSRVDGRLLQIPRNLDVRLLHYRRDLLGDAVPQTWTGLADTAALLTHPPLAGFLFPGRESGLFGSFYELLIGAGGDLFDEHRRPAFDSPVGLWSVRFLADLYLVRRVTPRALPEWHYDEISAEFRAGRAAMVCDWPGSYHLYRNPATCQVSDAVRVAALPAGPSGRRPAYGGCHSFAVPATARNPEGGTALLRWLTSTEAQLGEARQGSIPCRASALGRFREELKEDPVETFRWQLLTEAVDTMIIPPRFAEYPLCEEAIWRAVQRAMVGDWSPDHALQRAAADVSQLVGAA